MWLACSALFHEFCVSMPLTCITFCVQQISRAPTVRQVEVIIGIITAAVLVWLLLIVIVIVLGVSGLPFVKKLQFTLHARMMFGIIAWGAFILASYISVVLRNAVIINSLQRRHQNSITSLKVSLLLTLSTSTM